MLQLLKRIIPLILLILGGYLILWPGDKILIVQPEDFSSGYARHTRLHGDKALSITEYIKSATADRKIEINGEQWLELYNKITHPNKFPEIDARTYSLKYNSFIFKPQEPPFNELLNLPLNIHYISVDKGRKWLSVRASYPQDVYRVPPQYIYPQRTNGIFLAAASFLVYLLIPRKKFTDDEIHYPHTSTVLVPDILGLVMTSFFILMPFPIVWETNSASSIFSLSQGWVWLTVGMWLIAAVSLMFLRVGLNYSTLCYRITREGLYETKGNKTSLFLWTEIDFFQSYKTKISSRIAALLILFGNSLQAIGLGMALDGREEYGINIMSKDGRKIKVMANSLEDFDDIVRSLKEHGIARKRKKNRQ